LPFTLAQDQTSLKKMSVEESLRIWVDDKASIEDLRVLFSTVNVQVEEVHTAAGTYFLIQKKA
jgi:TusA-related sulfurtransferase